MRTNNRQTMSDADRYFIANALRTAAEQYKQDAADTRAHSAFQINDGLKSLARQFDDQHAQAIKLAGMFEEAEEIVIPTDSSREEERT